MNLIEEGRLNLGQLSAFTRRPPIFAPGAAFWDDPHIATEMLKAHLDPDLDAASRRPEIIDATVAWIIERLGLAPGDSLLDLGCGPGLYCKRFAGAGLDVTGVDFSENSINYARAHDPHTNYIHQDYRAIDYAKRFDVVTLIFGDICTFSDADRDLIVRKAHRALKPGGHFVFDVTTLPMYRVRRSSPPVWSVSDRAGFWKPGPHLLLALVFDYPDDDTLLEQYVVIEEDGAASVYRNWFHFYDRESIEAVLDAHGFKVVGFYGDLTGARFDTDSNWLGVVAQKA